LYRYPRNVVFLGSLAYTVVATKTVVSGDSSADLMMRIMTSPMIDVLIRICPSCLPDIAVDDIHCLVHGVHPVVVGRVVAQLLDTSVRTLEDDLHLSVSRPKLLSIFSCEGVKQAACSRSALVAKSVSLSVRNFGVDFSASGRKSKRVRDKRLATMKAGAFGLRRLSRSLQSRRFLRSGIGTVAVFGGGITGFTSSDLRCLRSTFRSCLRGKVAGRSWAWDLHKARCDPARMALSMAIQLILVAWHTPHSPRNFIQNHQPAIVSVC
jgi:hypothetical protein